MDYIATNDAYSRVQKIQAEENDDGTLSPRYGLSDTALAAISQITVAVVALLDAVQDGATSGPTASGQAQSLDLLSGIGQKLDAVSAALAAVAPASEHVAITPNDDTALTGVRALYVGVGGTLVVTVGVDDVTYTVADGAVLQVNASKVKATGTTATDIVAWK